VTLSIAARCPQTGVLGIAIASSSPCVAARCAHARAGVGAVATQNVTDPRLGPRGLNLLASGASAPIALRALRTNAAHPEHRQIAIIDASGQTAGFSGTKCLGIHATAGGHGAIAAGNLLANSDVPRAMVETFADAPGSDLGDRLIAAIRGGVAAGGEAGPLHSAGMLLVDKVPWPVADLRIDWHDDPVGALAQLWTLWKPQLDSYVTRALDPDAAPAYGVAGEA
jgi:uncharacterized Ntn-hydrolase superfamily protein